MNNGRVLMGSLINQTREEVNTRLNPLLGLGDDGPRIRRILFKTLFSARRRDALFES
jgi:hypothetical protein